MKKEKKLSYTQKSCLSKAGKLMYQMGMLCPEARIGIAVSGGIDSWILLKVMVLHQRKLPFHLNLMALHVNPGFEPDNHKVLLDWLSEHGIAGYAEISDIGPRAHSIENYKNSPCFFCSWHRRKRLFQLVKKFKLTHLALGHTADDLVHNFFLNLAYSGRVEGMFPRESFFKGEFELIRPLLLVEKRLIKGAVKDWGLPVVENPCPSAQNSKREQIKVWLQGLWAEDKRIRKNIFSALKRWQIQGSGKP